MDGVDGDAVVHAGWLATGDAPALAADGVTTEERRDSGAGPDAGDPRRESAAAAAMDSGGGRDGERAGDAEADAIAVGIGARLERARAARGISQKRLATLVGVERPTVCRWERGARIPSIPALLRTAAALAVPPSALLPDADPDGGVPDDGEGNP